MVRVAIMIVLATLVTAACVDVAPEHHCTQMEDCVLDGMAGHCEPTGFCSFPDPTCGTMGFRYHEHTGDHAGICSLSPTVATEVAAVDLAASDDTIQASCAPAGARDELYEISTPIPQVIFIDTAQSSTTIATALSLHQGTCPPTGQTELDCTLRSCGALPYGQLAVSVPPGTYCLVVEEGDPGATPAQVGLRVIPAGRMGAGLSPPGQPAMTYSTCDQIHQGTAACGAPEASSEFGFLLATCPSQILQLGAMVDPDDGAGLDVALSLRVTSPVGSELACVDAMTGTAAETFNGDLPGPGPYWLMVDRAGGSACGAFDFTYTLAVVPQT